MGSVGFLEEFWWRLVIVGVGIFRFGIVVVCGVFVSFVKCVAGFFRLFEVRNFIVLVFIKKKVLCF